MVGLLDGGETRVLLPPLLAIGLALLTRQVIPSLFCGVWAGAALLLSREHAPVRSAALGLFRAVDTHIVSGLAEPDHVKVVVFSLSIGGLVGVIVRSGAMEGLVRSLARHAVTPVRVQLAAWALGLLIFFDDYANTLVVGSTFRSLADRARISRAKLAYIVDATSAPVASLALLSTWIGYELGLIGEGLKAAGLPGDAYSLFLASLPYRFYALLILVMIPAGILLRRDFGPMLTAERLARFGGAAGQLAEELAPRACPKARWFDAAVPVGILIAATVTGIAFSGYGRLEPGISPSPVAVLSAADSYSVLLWSSLLAGISALGLATIRDLLPFAEAMEGWLDGVRSMVPAIVILALAWGLSAVTRELGTGQYACGLLSGRLPAWIVPGAVFATAAVISFATGSSWGTMAIIFPVVIPLAAGIDPEGGLLPAVVGAVLTGSVWGDHCSPVSDTTVMSSMASGCGHIEHVRTQLPYALLFGLLALLFGYLPAGLGIDPYLLFGLQAATGLLVIRFAGRTE